MWVILGYLKTDARLVKINRFCTYVFRIRFTTTYDPCLRSGHFMIDHTHIQKISKLVKLRWAIKQTHSLFYCFFFLNSKLFISYRIANVMFYVFRIKLNQFHLLYIRPWPLIQKNGFLLAYAFLMQEGLVEMEPMQQLSECWERVSH